MLPNKTLTSEQIANPPEGATHYTDPAGCTVNSSGGLLSSAQQFAELALYRYSSTEWMLGGERV